MKNRVRKRDDDPSVQSPDKKRPAAFRRQRTMQAQAAARAAAAGPAAAAEVEIA